MRRRLNRALAGAFAALALAAAAQAQPALTSPGWRPPPRQPCRAVQAPRRLPSAAALVDTAGLLSVIADSGAAGYVLLSAQFSAEGELAMMGLVETDLDEARASRLATAAATFAERQAAAGAPWSVRLRLTSGPRPTVAVQRSEYCPATVLPPVRSGNAFYSAVGAMADAPPIGELLLLRAIDERGEVTRTDVIDVAGTPPTLAYLAPTVLRADRYLPALLDRRPVIQVDTLSFAVRQMAAGSRHDGVGDILKNYSFEIRFLHPR